jgi:hypothetical protein
MSRLFSVSRLAPVSLLAGLLALSQGALAQEEESEAASRRSARNADNEVIREVVKGFYFKADIGSTMWLNSHGLVRTQGALLAGVMALGLGLGSEFIDRERFSAAWEVQVGQGLFNGPLLDEVVAVQSTRPLVQGDIHTFTGTGAIELSTYLSRRFSLGARAGGGVLMAPLLMDDAGYQEELVNPWGRGASLHDGPAPLVLFGPTIEYYTKLSHFSVGADVDITYVLGFDLGISPLGYLKYTFGRRRDAGEG